MAARKRESQVSSLGVLTFCELCKCSIRFRVAAGREIGPEDSPTRIGSVPLKWSAQLINSDWRQAKKIWRLMGIFRDSHSNRSESRARSLGNWPSCLPVRPPAHLSEASTAAAAAAAGKQTSRTERKKNKNKICGLRLAGCFRSG